MLELYSVQELCQILFLFLFFKNFTAEEKIVPGSGGFWCLVQKLYMADMPIFPDLDSFLLHIQDAGYKFPGRFILVESVGSTVFKVFARLIFPG